VIFGHFGSKIWFMLRFFRLPITARRLCASPRSGWCSSGGGSRRADDTQGAQRIAYHLIYNPHQTSPIHFDLVGFAP